MIVSDDASVREARALRVGGCCALGTFSQRFVWRGCAATRSRSCGSVRRWESGWGGGRGSCGGGRGGGRGRAWVRAFAWSVHEGRGW